MIRARLSLLFSRSKRRVAYRRFYELARDAFFAATRFTSRDESTLWSYFDWLQRYVAAANIKFDFQLQMLITRGAPWLRWRTRGRLLRRIVVDVLPAPVRFVFRHLRRAVRAQLRALRWLVRRLAALRRAVRRSVSRSYAEVEAALTSLALWPLRWLGARYRVRQLYLAGRRAAYGLLTLGGDIDGALEAFARLTKVRSRPEGKFRRQDRLMRELLPFARRLEDGIAAARLPLGRRGEERLLVSLAVWGGRYHELFERYSVPSLLAEGNLRALGERVTVFWHVFTTAAGRDRLMRHEPFQRLAKAGNIRFEEIPESLTKLAEGDARYWLYGVLSNTSVRLAARLGAGLHFMNPDLVYASGFFLSLHRLAHEGGRQIILSNSFRVMREKAAPVLDGLLGADGVLSVPAAELHSLGLGLIHPASRAVFLEEAEIAARIVPRSTLFAWREGATLVIHTAHYTPLYVSPALLQSATRLTYFTLDSSLARIWQDRRAGGPVPYIVRPEDRIGYLEISPKKAFETHKLSLARYVELFWETNTDNEFDLFERELRLPLKDAAAIAGLPAQDPVACRRAFLGILDRVHRAREELGVLSAEEAEANEAARIWSLHELLVSAELVFGFEVRQGCIPEVESKLDELRRVVGEARVSYTATPEEKADISPLFVVFLRLGLFDEFVELWRRVKLDLPPEIETLVRYCQEAYPLNHWRGKEYRARHPDEEVYVMGAIVWGDEFIENFMQYNLRSMLAPGNLPALSERGSVVFSILTNPAGELQIRRHPVFAQLSRLADIEFSHIPEALLSYLKSDYLSSHFYVFYGIVDHCSIFFAQGANAHLFMIPVDAIVAQGSLDAMARYGREGFGCCGGGNIVAESETFLPALREHYGRELVIAISSAELATLAARHAHHYFRSQVVAAENRDFGRHPRDVFWPVPGGVEIHSVFIHPLFITATTLQRYTRKHYANIDYGMIPRMCENAGMVKIIERPAEAYINNFSAAGRRYPTTGRPFSHADFLSEHAYSYPIQKSLFARGQRLPCRLSGWTPYRDPASDVREIMAGLVASPPVAAE